MSSPTFRGLGCLLALLVIAPLRADEAAMAPVWKISDADSTVYLTIGDLILAQTGQYARLHEVLLVERNRNGIPEIEKFLATDRDVMFPVEAGHLVGEDSVVDLLREKGYEVMPLANGE